MSFPRVIPTLLLSGKKLVKTTRFTDPVYIGDPINAVKIFNDKGADELVLLDILATQNKSEPSFDIIESIASECFMPVAYGGGVKTLDQVRRILAIGIEKVVINAAAIADAHFIRAIADEFGSQAVIVSIDVRRRMLGRYEVVGARGAKGIGVDPVTYAKRCQDMGSGEILLTSVDREGTLEGYDHDLIKKVAASVSIPVIAAGGAKDVSDLAKAVQSSKAAAVSGGAIFVFQGKHKAVLITYPDPQVLLEAFESAGA